MEEPPAVSAADVTGWLVGRLPDGWFEGEPAVSIDRDEILIVGRIPAPTPVADADPASVAEGRASRFREDTRNARIEVAQEAEAKYARKVSWGVEVGDYRYLFTTLAAPAMTRLRQPERQVLDTLVEAGVARSRAEALAWCVQLVGQNEQEWITSLRTALDDVERVRRQGPA
jgi:GTP1/Obg family GTP-binding protein